MEIKISTCISCPLLEHRYRNYYFCAHPKGPKESWNVMIDEIGRHEKCPLNKHPLTIVGDYP